MSQPQTELCFNRVELSYVPPTIRVVPNLLCPICVGTPANLLVKTWNCALNRALELNTKVSFMLCCCGNTIELFLAVHKEKDSPNIMYCIQKSSEEGAAGIPANWWVRTT